MDEANQSTDIEERHSEWYGQEMDRLDSVVSDLLNFVDGSDDVQIISHGRSPDSSGTHKVQFRFEVDGQAFEEYEDSVTDEER